MKSEYIESLTTQSETYYVRQDRLDDLQKVDVIVFDCDGVLLDVKDSYSKAVSKTTQALIEVMTGFRVPEEIYDSRIIWTYKRTGGFNNDWALTYALTLRTLAEIPKQGLKKIGIISGKALETKSLKKRLQYLRENRVKTVVPTDFLYENLMNFAKDLDSSGWEAVNKLLMDRLNNEIIDVLGYPGGIGESLVTTIFEEIFSGSKLFTSNFGIKGIYGYKEPGLIEKEKVIIQEDTFKRLSDFIGGNRFGIASSSPAVTAMHVLGASISRIPETARVWHETVDKAQEKDDVKVLHKPHPFSLLKASEPFQPYDRVLYVGDTLADRLMVTNSGDPKYLFAGVYGNLHSSDEAKKDFIMSNADVVTSSVNDLPEILENLRGK